MTDRYKGVTVRFAEDLRSDDAEHLIAVIRMLRGVVAVDPQDLQVEDLVARQDPPGMIVSIPVSDETYQKIEALAGGASIQDTVAAAVEDLRRKRFWDDVDASRAAMRADPVAGAEEEAERKLLEGTLMDDLEDEPPYPSPSSS